MTRQIETVIALEGAGGTVVDARTRRYIRVDLAGNRYWVGKMGGIREGVCVRRSRSCDSVVVAGVVIAKGFGTRFGAGSWDG